MALLNRPDTMERINTPELAKAFIEEQIQDIKVLETVFKGKTVFKNM